MWILAAGNLSLAALFGSELLNENWLRYPIGAQNCGWAYRTIENYLTTTWVIVALLGAAIAFLAFGRGLHARILVGISAPFAAIAFSLTLGRCE